MVASFTQQRKIQRRIFLMGQNYLLGQNAFTKKKKNFK